MQYTHSQDIFVQHEASRILLEALKYSGGPSEISELADVPGFMQSLLDAVSSMVQVRSSHTLYYEHKPSKPTHLTSLWIGSVTCCNGPQ
jgi:hypothetical protein